MGMFFKRGQILEEWGQLLPTYLIGSKLQKVHFQMEKTKRHPTRQGERYNEDEERKGKIKEKGSETVWQDMVLEPEDLVFCIVFLSFSENVEHWEARTNLSCSKEKEGGQVREGNRSIHTEYCIYCDYYCCASAAERSRI